MPSFQKLVETKLCGVENSSATGRTLELNYDTAHLVVKLTPSAGYDLLFALQPKPGFLPEAGRGRPKFLKIEDGANGAGQPVSRPLSRPSPTANLAGSWKGDPLEPQVRPPRSPKAKRSYLL
jgi:hypothetical protein